MDPLADLIQQKAARVKARAAMEERIEVEMSELMDSGIRVNPAVAAAYRATGPWTGLPAAAAEAVPAEGAP